MPSTPEPMILTPPEIDAILQRAKDYWRIVYASQGSPPETFLVNESEYRLLLSIRGPEGDLHFVDPGPAVEMSLMGMRVVNPERLGWSDMACCPSVGEGSAVDTETSTDTEWEAAVHRMITEVKRRRA